jgi:hypothetical protein
MKVKIMDSPPLATAIMGKPVASDPRISGILSGDLNFIQPVSFSTFISEAFLRAPASRPARRDPYSQT